MQILVAEKFVFTELDGVRTLVRINETCMTALPDEAMIMTQANTKKARQKNL